ncbi:MAG: M28 family peptidase [Saprospiraceae bacterium]|nr:M28 family peptidase [Saprospiraceae bacterium]
MDAFKGCNGDTDTRTGVVTEKPLPTLDIPSFNADSAYVFTEKIVGMSPRIVGTEGSKKVKTYLIQQFKKYGADIVEQPFTVKTFDGKTHAATNIIARCNMQATKRILLSAHWDSRPFADSREETDPAHRNKPILGADDSGSAVAMLIEMARQLQAKPLSNIGVDIVLFDAEDYGDTSKTRPLTDAQADAQNKTWALGSQHWSATPHVAGYTAAYGINLDMAGAKDARFTKELNSQKYASGVVEKVWRVARFHGFGSYFVEASSSFEMLDDHVYVNQLAKIPTIDIINNSAETNAFGKYWHTHNDNMSVIDRATMKAVGQTVLSVLHYEEAKAFDY